MQHKIVVLVIACICFFLYVISKDTTYFLRDDFDFLLYAKYPISNTLLIPHNQHIVILPRLLFAIESILFGMNHNLYLIVSILLHGLVLYGMYRVIQIITKSKKFSLLFTLICVVPGSSYKVIALANSQMFLLASLLGLLSILVLLLFKKTNNSLYPIISCIAGLLASWCHGIGLAVLLASVCVCVLNKRISWKLKLTTLLIGIAGVVTYILFVGSSLRSDLNSQAIQTKVPMIQHFIQKGIIDGSMWGIIMPRFTYNNISPNLIPPLLIALMLVSILVFFQLRNQLKNMWNSIEIFIIFILSHFFILSIGRANNLMYSVSPQFTYFPKVLITVLLATILFQYWMINSTRITKLILVSFVLCVFFVQFMFYTDRLNAFEPRIVFTKTYIQAILHTTTTQKEVINFPLPDCINSNMHFQDIAYVYKVKNSPHYIDQKHIPDINSYINSIQDPIVKETYHTALHHLDMFSSN